MLFIVLINKKFGRWITQKRTMKNKKETMATSVPQNSEFIGQFGVYLRFLIDDTQKILREPRERVVWVRSA